MHSDPKRLRELPPATALRLLGSVPIGRIVFTAHALPAIRPVNHVLVDGDVVLRCHAGAALLGAIGQVVAYEADDIDPETHAGWSVIVTGKADEVTGADEVAHYERLLRPHVDLTMEHVVRISPEIITGFELTDVTQDAKDLIA
ncbi:pyridoxamine 5'-phosphate oxidase family protein [Haloechinothrix salitolerans]|uniref:Pyridoxamine 5'-phosphate oxidase family protein n=1 Tax=Haloechinothrix salitolerans TaxID=926830 RepID=A0ABW2C3B3_9PSEU